MAWCKFSTACRNLLGGGAEMGSSFHDQFANSVVYVYDGAPPASPNLAVQGNLLGKITKDGLTFTFGSPTHGLNFDECVGGVIPKVSADLWKMTGTARGIAGWGRLMANAADNLGDDTDLVFPRVDFDIASAGASMKLANLLIEVGAPTDVQTFAVTMPGG